MNSPAPGTDDAPLRVLIATGVYPPRIGGPAIQAELFARELVRRGVNVRVLTHGPPAEDTKGVRVDYLEHGSGRGSMATIRRHLFIARQVFRVFREFRPDAVQMQTAAGIFPLWVGLAARRSGTPSWVKFAADPVLEFLHGRASVDRGRASPDWKLSLRGAAAKFIAKLVFRVHRFVWVTTPTVGETLVSQWGVSRSRIIVAPNLVDLPKGGEMEEAKAARLAPEPLRLLVVSRLDVIKGVDVAIQALAELKDIPAVLRVVGEGRGEYAADLLRLAERLGVSDRIEWAGKVAREHLDEEYRAADLLVVPSRYEAFCAVILEAYAAGLPVVASNVGGIPYVVQNGECARLVEPEDAPELARAIVDLISDAKQYDRLRRAGLKRASGFCAEAGVDKWLQTFRTPGGAAAAHEVDKKVKDDVTEKPSPK